MNNPFSNITCPAWVSSSYSYVRSWTPSFAPITNAYHYCNKAPYAFMVQGGFLGSLSKTSHYALFFCLASFLATGVLAGYGETEKFERAYQMNNSNDFGEFASRVSKICFLGMIISASIHLSCFGTNFIQNRAVIWIQQYS